MLAEPIPERPVTNWTEPAVIRACELDDGTPIINEGGTAEVSDFRPLPDGSLFYSMGQMIHSMMISMIDKA